MSLLDIRELSTPGGQPIPPGPSEDFNLNFEGETILEKFFRLKNTFKVKLESGEISQEQYNRFLTQLRIEYAVESTMRNCITQERVDNLFKGKAFTFHNIDPVVVIDSIGNTGANK